MFPSYFRLADAIEFCDQQHGKISSEVLIESQSQSRDENVYLTSFSHSGLALKCYECDNSGNPACGEYFKAYQFDARECPYPDKCGLQRQPPEGKSILCGGEINT